MSSKSRRNPFAYGGLAGFQLLQAGDTSEGACAAHLHVTFADRFSIATFDLEDRTFT